MAFSFFKRFKNEKKNVGGAAPLYYDLTVKEVITETSDAISIVFDQPKEKITYQSGQFLTLIMEINGKEVRRCTKY